MPTDRETFMPIHNDADWALFWRVNGAAIPLDERLAYALARCQSLMIGGDDTPLFRVGFVD